MLRELGSAPRGALWRRSQWRSKHSPLRSSRDQPRPRSATMSSQSQFADETSQGPAEGERSRSAPTATQTRCGARAAPETSGRTTRTHSAAMTTTGVATGGATGAAMELEQLQHPPVARRRLAQCAARRTASSKQTRGNVRDVSWEPSPILDERIHYAQRGRPYYVNYLSCAASTAASRCPYNRGPCNKRLDDPETDRRAGQLCSRCKQDQRDRRAARGNF